jgi:hypothetical protein
MGSLLTVASGLAWDPQIRGILAVAVGFVVLAGAVYLLLATNMGARLGLLVALAGLFGWMSILTLYWWVNPPGIGPAGDPPYWLVEEIHVTGSDEPPALREAQRLPTPDERVTPDQVIAEAPELAAELGSEPELSDIAALDATLLPPDLFGGWRVTGTADAGEAQAAADEALVDEGVFPDATSYTHTSAFQAGGKTRVGEVCDEGDAFFAYYACRAWFRVTEPFKTHPTQWAVAEVRPLIPQETVPGEAPPRPVVDRTQPAIWVIMERQLGTTRVLPFTYFVVSIIGFVVFTTILHYRDKTLRRNLDEAEGVAPVAV